MNLRCIYCQTPFTLSRAEMVAAIQHMTEKNMNHYDAHCPRCRRANSISRQRMELFFPNWQEAAKQAASVAEREPASASMKTVPLPKGAKAAAKITPAKKPAAKKPAAKPAAKKATAKPAAKKAPAKKKK
jgi:phage FluMu protein Com